MLHFPPFPCFFIFSHTTSLPSVNSFSVYLFVFTDLFRTYREPATYMTCHWQLITDALATGSFSCILLPNNNRAKSMSCNSIFSKFNTKSVYYQMHYNFLPTIHKTIYTNSTFSVTNSIFRQNFPFYTTWHILHIVLLCLCENEMYFSFYVLTSHFACCVSQILTGISGTSSTLFNSIFHLLAVPERL